MTVDRVWKSLPVKSSEVSLAKVLRCGQTFRWKNVDHVWSFSIDDRIILLKQEHDDLQYSWIMPEDKIDNINKQEKETLEFINDYFSLSTSLENLYSSWLKVDEKYRKKIGSSPFIKFPGIRILRQDPWETTVSFICSSNNNVKRISKMVDSLCTNFGTYINDFEGIPFHSFPKPADLAKPETEGLLRDLGFGYRAKYIYKTACKFVDNEGFPDITIEQLNSMRNKSYEEAHQFLLQLDGVGPKVADCICLMALDKHDIVPVDTHVYQIAMRDFKFKGKKDLKTMNQQVYHEIRLFFKELFGDYSGWAQSVLFASDLSDLNNGVNQITTKEVKVENHSIEVKKRKVISGDGKKIVKQTKIEIKEE